MYPPPHHQSNDIKKMIAVIESYPLGMLVSAHEGKPFVTHIPIIYNQKTGKLVAHIDKNNPQLATLTDGAEVTIVFKGPDTYISPSIYSTEQLPTWNYIIVHISGKITLIHDTDAVKESMVAMTKFLEGTTQKYVLKKDNPSMERLVDYIQAFEVTITNWEGKFKLSQDKKKTDYEAAKEELIQNSSKLETEIIEHIYN